MTRVSPEWLALREPADAAARSTELVARIPAAGEHVIHDLGCGTGAMRRWLAPLLPGPQRWVLHDSDPDLLAIAGGEVETALSDITRLEARDLAGATLVTASALLDLLTGDELRRLVALITEAGCPALLTLSVAGRVELDPPGPLDQALTAAFNAHQRGGGLLGPDAPAVAAEQFARLGTEVIERPSPWRLGPAQSELAAEWLAGWVGAACEQEPGLRAAADGYMRRGLRAVTVDHRDLLAIPPQAVSKRGESA